MSKGKEIETNDRFRDGQVVQNADARVYLGGVQGIKEGRMTVENAALSSLPCGLCQLVSHGDPYSWNLAGSIDFHIPYVATEHKVQAELTIVLHSPHPQLSVSVS